MTTWSHLDLDVFDEGAIEDTYIGPPLFLDDDDPDETSPVVRMWAELPGTIVGVPPQPGRAR